MTWCSRHAHDAVWSAIDMLPYLTLPSGATALEGPWPGKPPPSIPLYLSPFFSTLSRPAFSSLPPRHPAISSVVFPFFSCLPVCLQISFCTLFRHPFLLHGLPNVDEMFLLRWQCLHLDRAGTLLGLSGFSSLRSHRLVQIFCGVSFFPIHREAVRRLPLSSMFLLHTLQSVILWFYICRFWIF